MAGGCASRCPLDTEVGKLLALDSQDEFKSIQPQWSLYNSRSNFSRVLVSGILFRKNEEHIIGAGKRK